MSTSEIERYRKYLTIDRTDLDQCLVEQPEIYYHVSREFAQAVAERDAVKLDLEKLQAQLDQELRIQAAQKSEKITEAGIESRIIINADVQSLQQTYLGARMFAEEWQALKEAFQQRSFMLRELVALFIAQRHDLAMENGTAQVRIDLSEQNRKRNDELRRQRRAKA